jgi:tetratricopeptide (TPR) repeat protein
MPNTQMLISQIRNLIGKDEFAIAIQKLCALLKNSPLLDHAIQQSARYNNVIRQIRLGLVDFESANITQNEIRHGILELLREIEDKGKESAIEAEIEYYVLKIEKNIIKNSSISVGNNMMIGDKQVKNEANIEGSLNPTVIQGSDSSTITVNINKQEVNINSKAKKYFKKGTKCIEQQKYEEALIAFNDAISEDDKYAKAYLNRGFAKYGLNMYSDAITDFEIALDLEQTLWEAQHNLGILYIGNGQKEKGCHCLKQAKERGFSASEKAYYRHCT